MQRPGRKNFVLIVARELASIVAMPIFVVDPEGRLVFFNEPAEEILGLQFTEAGEMAVGEWGTMWKPEDPDGIPVPPEELPLAVAFSRGKPAHRPLCITPPSGIRRKIEITAFPLYSKPGTIAGAVAIFWEPSEGQ